MKQWKLVLARTFHPTMETTAADNPRFRQKNTIPTLCNPIFLLLQQDHWKSEMDFSNCPV